LSHPAASAPPFPGFSCLAPRLHSADPCALIPRIFPYRCVPPLLSACCSFCIGRSTNSTPSVSLCIPRFAVAFLPSFLRAPRSSRFSCLNPSSRPPFDCPVTIFAPRSFACHSHVLMYLSSAITILPPPDLYIGIWFSGSSRGIIVPFLLSSAIVSSSTYWCPSCVCRVLWRGNRYKSAPSLPLCSAGSPAAESIW
jgi:hypothetical protein